MTMRAVKSPVAKPTTVASATTAARKLVKLHLAGVDMVTVDSFKIAAMVNGTLTPVIKTTITYPETADASDLACAVESLSGVVATTWSTVAITITRTF